MYMYTHVTAFDYVILNAAVYTLFLSLPYSPPILVSRGWEADSEVELQLPPWPASAWDEIHNFSYEYVNTLSLAPFVCLC